MFKWLKKNWKTLLQYIVQVVIATGAGAVGGIYMAPEVVEYKQQEIVQPTQDSTGTNSDTLNIEE